MTVLLQRGKRLTSAERVNRGEESYTYVDMPLAGTMAQVDAALAALESGKADETTQAIIAAREGLVTETRTVGMSGTTAQQEDAAES